MDDDLDLMVGDYVVDANETKWVVYVIIDGVAYLEEYIEDRRCREIPVSKIKRNEPAEEIYGDFWFEDDPRLDAWIDKQLKEES